MRWLALLFALSVATAAPSVASAQWLDPDNRWTCWGCNAHSEHFESAVVIDMGLRAAPFLRPSWQNPIGRVLITGPLIGGGIELMDLVQCRNGHYCGTPDTGFSPVDIAWATAGAIVSELGTALLRAVWRGL